MPSLKTCWKPCATCAELDDDRGCLFGSPGKLLLKTEHSASCRLAHVPSCVSSVKDSLHIESIELGRRAAHNSSGIAQSTTGPAHM